MKLNYNIFKYLLFICLFLSCFIKYYKIQQLIIIGCFFLLFKWITNLRACTVGYIECKIRNIKKKDSIIYSIINPIYDINKYQYKYYIYLFTIIILFINLYLLLT